MQQKNLRIKLYLGMLLLLNQHIDPREYKRQTHGKCSSSCVNVTCMTVYVVSYFIIQSNTHWKIVAKILPKLVEAK